MKKFYVLHLIKNNIFYCLIYFVFIIEVYINLKSKYLWNDESFTFHIIQHSFPDIINLTTQDVHPFLYYFICKLFVYNINNTFTQIFVLRIVSVIPYLLLLIIANTYIKKHFSKTTSEFFMFFIISMPLLSDNIYQVRMYGWATLFTTVLYLFFIYACNHNNIKVFIYITLFALLSSYTHYFALLTVMIIYLFFLILFIKNKYRLRYLISSVIIDVFCYLPWTNALISQASGESNTTFNFHIDIKGIVHIIIDSFSPIHHKSILYLLPLVFVILLIVILIKNRILKNHIILIGICIPIILILLSILFSMITDHQVLFARYITPAMGIFWLSISMIIYNINEYNIYKYLLVVLTLTIGGLTLINNTLTNNDNANKFNITLNLFNKIPRNSAIIYNDAGIMASSATYLNNNFILNSKNNEVYNKTFNNLNTKDTVQLSNKFKNTYYIHSSHPVNKFISQFNHKYQKEKIGKIYLPLDGDGFADVYKIR